MAPVAKLLPFTKPETKPLNAGEIYYLWESLTAGHRINSILETYMMNTEDPELHLFLKSMIDTNTRSRIEPLEKVLKDEGFSVPPRPGTKITQGKPGISQEIKLTDEEVIRSVTTWGQFGIKLDGRGVGVCVNEEIRSVFTELLNLDLKAYSTFLDLGISRQVFFPPPPANARQNSLNIDEVARLWEELTARHLTVVNLETFLMNTNDPELIQLLQNSVQKIAYPQIEKLEKVLKAEGFTVPSRPPNRLVQAKPGKLTKIILKDAEIIGELTVGNQIAIDHHIRSYCAAMRQDVRDLFNEFISTEIESYQRIMQLANKRHALMIPPVVTSHKG
ncbi:MAG: DUF3231 family protein [Candidatus Saccharibacteria bacterium]